jgi:hypothetical protein
MMRFKMGYEVIHHTGFWGEDHGHSCWWAQDKKAIIISVHKSECLIEYSNGEREWADKSNLERPSD